MIRPAVLFLLLPATAAANTSSVFSPDVDDGEREAEYRVSFVPEDEPAPELFSHRLHYQQAFNDSWRARILASQRSVGGDTLDLSYTRLELQWQYLEDQNAGWDAALRFEAQAGDEGPDRQARPGRRLAVARERAGSTPDRSRCRAGPAAGDPGPGHPRDRQRHAPRRGDVQRPEHHGGHGQLRRAGAPARPRAEGEDRARLVAAGQLPVRRLGRGGRRRLPPDGHPRLLNQRATSRLHDRLSQLSASLPAAARTSVSMAAAAGVIGRWVGVTRLALRRTVGRSIGRICTPQVSLAIRLVTSAGEVISRKSLAASSFMPMR